MPQSRSSADLEFSTSMRTVSFGFHVALIAVFHRATVPLATHDDAEQRAPRVIAGRRRGILVALVGNGVAQAAAAVGTALLTEMVFDRLVAGGARSTMAVLAPLALALVVAAAAVAWLRSRERVDAERLGQSYVHALRMKLYDRLSAVAPRSLQSRSRGGVMLRFVGDLNAIKQWVSLGLSRLIVAGTFVSGALVGLAFVNAALCVAVGVVVLAGAAVSLLLARPLRDRSREARRRSARIAANVNEKVASIGVVQVFGQTARERERIRRQSRRLREAMIARARVIGVLRGVAEGTAALASVAVLLVGAAEVNAGRASPGTVVAAMSIVGLLMAPLRDLGRVQEYWHASRVSLEKAEDFLTTPTMLRDDAGAPELGRVVGRLAFEDVTLAGSLHGVSAVAQPGTVVLVSGPNGAGKSSLLALAARMVDPDAGRVTLDGRDLSDHSMASVRAAVSIAGPDLPLLRGSVARNLRYRWPDAPAQELERVRELCGLDDLVDALPDGDATMIRDGGVNLSAGQRQRLTLARALVGDPRVLLLDEADANLDADARRVVDRVVRQLRGCCTILLVSHRPEALELADAVWGLQEGRLVAHRDGEAARV